MISHDSSDLVLRKQLIEQQAGGSAAIKMTRQELVPKDLIQKCERHKTIVKVCYKLSIQCTRKKNRKLKDQIPQSQTSTSPNHGRA